MMRLAACVLLIMPACTRPAPAGGLDGGARAGVPGFPALLRDPRAYDAYNGIEPSEFERFADEWHLVTARYRADRDQQRVVFANDIAWKALLEGGKAFPDGAMFAKAGFEVGTDPRFPSSRVPGAQLRLLLMKRDFKRYKDTDGWGYALLNRAGAVLASGERVATVTPYNSIREFETACHACHRLVAATDYVFSEPMFAAVTRNAPALPLRALRENFRAPAAGDVAHVGIVLAHAQVENPAADALLYMELALFEGSLPELMGALVNLATDEQKAFVVYDPGTGLYALARALPPTPACLRRARFQSGSVAGQHLPAANLAEVTRSVLLCNGNAQPP